MLHRVRRDMWSSVVTDPVEQVVSDRQNEIHERREVAQKGRLFIDHLQSSSDKRVNGKRCCGAAES